MYFTYSNNHQFTGLRKTTAIASLCLLLITTPGYRVLAQDTTSEALSVEEDLLNVRKENIRRQLQLNKLEKELLEAKKVIQALKGESNLSEVENQENELEGLDIEQSKKQIQEMIEAQTIITQENEDLIKELEIKESKLLTIENEKTQLNQQLNAVKEDVNTMFSSLMGEGQLKISESDQDYIKVLDFVTGRADITEVFSQETIDALKDKSAKDLINRKVIAPETGGNTLSAQIAARVNQLMNLEQEDADLSFDDDEKSDSAYTVALKPLEEERDNETRWITVKSGDTLWAIAKRAYGDGNLYNRIFEANPQVLANPNVIKPKQRLRVPV